MRKFKEEEGYRCVETAEEVLHQVPLSDITSTESFIRRFARAMLWKETRLETPGGVIFPLHAPVGACFLRRVLDGTSPCLQEPPSCPFLGSLQFPESGVAGAAQLAAFLLQHPEVQSCPYARRITERAFFNLCNSEWVPFVAAGARHAMETGAIVMTADGAFHPRIDGGAPWPTRTCPDIPQEATWAACSGTLQLAVVEDQLRIYPAGRKLAPWLSASLVAPTQDGRHVAIPAPHAADPFFLVFDETGESLACGPFPLPFALDSRVRHAVFAQSTAKGGRKVQLAAFVGNVSEPFWLQTGCWDLPESALQLACEAETVGVLTEDDRVWRLGTDGRSERRHFPQCQQITFLDGGMMAILWKDGWRLTFWDADTVRDFPLLIPARRIFPSRDGKLAAATAGRITEITPDGAVADFRCADALWMSRRGYMEQAPDGYIWHILDDAPVHGDFWKIAPAAVWFVEPAANLRIRQDDDMFSLTAELISYFISTLPNPPEGILARLVREAPTRVRREFERLLRRHPWLYGFDGPAENWPVRVRPLEECQHFD